MPRAATARAVPLAPAAGALPIAGSVPGVPTAGNSPEWSVTELAGAIKRQLEGEFGTVRLRAEISNYRGPHSSGHAYFCLKDAGARIDAVLWKGTFSRLRIRPEEGMEVVVTGKVTTYPGKSAYQIMVDTLEPAGQGALMAVLEARRKALAAEGLFAPERKRPLPFLPRVIGVVTSPTGAVIRDILHRLADRFPVEVVVWPVRVQGETCAEEVAAAIRGFNALTPGGAVPRPDLLIVARGGGSIEDLWGFNEEAVVRAAADSAIPLVSAVGHETDTTLIDLAADRRAPTPTGAAEIAVPVRADLAAAVDDLGHRLAGAARRGLDRARADLKGLARAMPAPAEVVATPRQRLDLASARLAPAYVAARRGHEARLARVAALFARHPPALILTRARERLAGIDHRPRHALERVIAVRGVLLTQQGGRLVAARDASLQRAGMRVARSRDRTDAAERGLAQAFARDLERRRAAFARLATLFNTLNHRAVLERGYALVLDEAGRPLRRGGETREGQRVALEFADRQVGATLDGEGPPRRASRAARAGPRPPAAQRSLFDA